MTMEELTPDYPPEANPPPPGTGTFWLIFFGLLAMAAFVMVTLFFTIEWMIHNV